MARRGSLDGVRERIFQVVGLGSVSIAPACGEPPVVTSDGGDETETSTSAGETTGAEPMHSTEFVDATSAPGGPEGGSEPWGDSGEPPELRFDFPPVQPTNGLDDRPYDGPPPEDCPVNRAASPEYVFPPSECMPFDHAAYNVVCFDAPADGCDALERECIFAAFECGIESWGSEITCGPFTHDLGECCYVVAGICPVGRPFTVEGLARIAAVRRGAGWSKELAPDTATLDRATRAALADVWSQEALREHASVASFARFILQLLSLGAPADLVDAAQRALREEIEHARCGFAFASAYAGTPLEPGPLDISHGLEGSREPAEIAASLAAEGCIAETISAALVAEAARRSRDPAVHDALEQIAIEELEHAELAWRALRWIFASARPDVRRAVHRVFADAESHVGLRAATELSGDVSRMRDHGYIPQPEQERLAAAVLVEVVLPAARATLGDDNGSRPELSR